ncbi:hypothetical protein HYW55_01295 [Candidatus Gottesmanbacteria bacterium]|nr:hypothetical protein [Candidatus Gottesmanbacteria bacterium]
MPQRVPDPKLVEKVERLLRHFPGPPMIHSKVEFHVPKDDAELSVALDTIRQRYGLDWGHNRVWFETSLFDANFRKQPDTGQSYIVWKK